MKPEVIFTKSAPVTGFSEGTESPIAHTSGTEYSGAAKGFVGGRLSV